MFVTIASWLLLIVMPILAIRSLRFPGYALALVVSMYTIEHVLLQNRTGIPIGGTMINIFAGATCVAAIFAAYLRGELQGIHLNKVNASAYCLFLLTAASLIWTPDYNGAFEKLSKMFPYIAVVAILAPTCMVVPNQVEKFVIAMIVLGACVGMGLAGSSVGHRSVEFAVGLNEVEKANPLASGSFGGYLLICSLFAVHRFSLNKLKLMAIGIVCLMAVFVVAQSGSRGQLVGLALTCFIWIPITAKVTAKRSQIVAYLVVAGFCVAGYLFVDSFDLLDRFSSARMRSHSFGRLEMAYNLLQYAYAEGPVAILVGLGTSSAFHYIGFYPHVVPLEVMAEEGLLGFGLFVGFLFGVMGSFRQCLHEPRLLPTERSEICLFGALMTFETLLCLKQGSLLTSQPLFCFGLAGVYLLMNLRQRVYFRSHQASVMARQQTTWGHSANA